MPKQPTTPTAPHEFEMVRLSRAKAVLDVCPNTLRSYAKQGLPLYRMGRAVFVSKTELAAFIRARAMLRPQ